MAADKQISQNVSESVVALHRFLKVFHILRFKLASINKLNQNDVLIILPSRVPYLLGHLVGLVAVEALDALVRLVVELDVVGLALGVDHLEGVRPVAVQVAVPHGSAAVGEQEADLHGGGVGFNFISPCD